MSEQLTTYQITKRRIAGDMVPIPREIRYSERERLAMGRLFLKFGLSLTEIAAAFGASLPTVRRAITFTRGKA